MSHWKSLLDPSKFLCDADFTAEGREVQIARVSREKMPARPGEPESSAPMIFLATKDGKGEYNRPYKCPKSVMYGLSLLLGTETDGWVGKKITLFSAHCLSFGEREVCVRVRFPAEIDDKIRKWLKKRKAPAGAYMLPPETK